MKMASEDDTQYAIEWDDKNWDATPLRRQNSSSPPPPSGATHDQFPRRELLAFGLVFERVVDGVGG